jgi:hypothetical protein
MFVFARSITSSARPLNMALSPDKRFSHLLRPLDFNTEQVRRFKPLSCESDAKNPAAAFFFSSAIDA